MEEATCMVKVGGEYACFSRPEFKAERVTYDVMTPAAARGLLEAIFWKPEMRWEVREIWVLNSIRTMTVLRNEIDRRQTALPIVIENARQQRTSLLLKDVAYVVKASLQLGPHAKEPIAKYADQARRRIARGQCHHTPYFGTREFAAWFEPADGAEKPIETDRDLGTMLFDLAFCESTERAEVSFNRHGPDGPQVARGYAEALFFPAALRHGILHVPVERYAEKYRREGTDAA